MISRIWICFVLVLGRIVLILTTGNQKTASPQPTQIGLIITMLIAGQGRDPLLVARQRLFEAAITGKCLRM